MGLGLGLITVILQGRIMEDGKENQNYVRIVNVTVVHFLSFEGIDAGYMGVPRMKYYSYRHAQPSVNTTTNPFRVTSTE